jgi:hypothetical protein
MVIAGISNKSIQGDSWKKRSRVAYPKSNILFSKTNKTNPFTSRNTQMAIYPVRLLKNWRSSFLQTDHIKRNEDGAK